MLHKSCSTISESLQYLYDIVNRDVGPVNCGFDAALRLVVFTGAIKKRGKGTVKEAAGKAQQKASKKLGSSEQEAKDLAKKRQGQSTKEGWRCQGGKKQALTDIGWRAKVALANPAAFLAGAVQGWQRCPGAWWSGATTPAAADRGTPCAFLRSTAV
jgi:hypothetical protein